MRKANLIAVIILLLLPAVGLVVSDNNLIRWIVSLALISYPLVILLMQPLIKKDSEETDRLDYRNYFFSDGSPFCLQKWIWVWHMSFSLVPVSPGFLL